MDAQLATLLGVALGGVLTTGTKAVGDRVTTGRKQRAAARLIYGELHMNMGVVEALLKDEAWPPMEGWYRFVYERWLAYEETLAQHRDFGKWGAVSLSYGEMQMMEREWPDRVGQAISDDFHQTLHESLDGMQEAVDALRPLV